MTKIHVPRWLGGAAIAAGVLVALSELARLPYFFNDDFAEVARQPLTQVGNYLALVGMPLLILGLAGLYAVHAHKFGRFGKFAVLFAFFFSVIAAGAMWVGAFVEPTLAIEAPELLNDSDPGGPVMIGFIVTFIGLSLAWLLVAIATLRAGMLSRVASVLVLLGALAGGVPFPTPGAVVLMGIGVAWWGVGIARELRDSPDIDITTPTGSPAQRAGV